MTVLVLGYYRLLRSIVRTRPPLRRRLTRCRRCRIFFIAHACNAGRHDLRCPFGCQSCHRRAESTKRSVAFYREEGGKIKKRIQNGKRGEAKSKSAERAEPSGAMVEHVRMVVSGIEGRRVSREEVWAMLLRQRSLVGEGKAGDNGARSDERPP